MENKVLTIKDVAKMLGVNERTINRYAVDKVMPGFRVGNKWRFNKSEVEEWINKRRNLPVEEEASYMISNSRVSLTNTTTKLIPILGTAPCGSPNIAVEDKLGEIPVSNSILKDGQNYFFLQASGDSMNEKGINDGDYVLIRQQITARNGEVVVALIDDSSTIKEFYKTDTSVILKPCSSNKKHEPIILTRDFQIQGVVISTIPKEARGNTCL